MTFCTCNFLTDRTIVNYQVIFWSIPVEGKLSAPGL